MHRLFALHEVYVKALAAFRKGAPPPDDLRGLKAFCATIEKNHAIDVLRKSGTRKPNLLGDCDPGEHTAPEDGAGKRDAVDVGRQLEVLAQLFREGANARGGRGDPEGRRVEVFARGDRPATSASRRARWRAGCA